MVLYSYTCCRQSCLKWVYKASGRRKEFLPSRKRCSTGFFRKGYSVWNRMLENPVKIDPILIPSLCSTALTKVLRIKGWTESDQSRGGGGFRGVGVGGRRCSTSSVGKKGREKIPRPWLPARHDRGIGITVEHGRAVLSNPRRDKNRSINALYIRGRRGGARVRVDGMRKLKGRCGAERKGNAGKGEEEGERLGWPVGVCPI